jgi:hypothetical protein
VNVFFGVEKLPYGDGPDRMWRQSQHGRDLREVWRRMKSLTPVQAERILA